MKGPLYAPPKTLAARASVLVQNKPAKNGATLHNMTLNPKPALYLNDTRSARIASTVWVMSHNIKPSPCRMSVWGLGIRLWNNQVLASLGCKSLTQP